MKVQQAAFKHVPFPSHNVMAHFDLQQQNNLLTIKASFNASKILFIVTVILRPWHTHPPSFTCSVK